MTPRLLLALWSAALLARTSIPLEPLDLGKVAVLAPPMGYAVRSGRSVAGEPLTMKGQRYDHGVGLHSGSRMLVDLHGQGAQFTALAGVDEAKLALLAPLPGAAVPNGLQNHPGLATLDVWLDGKQVLDSGVMRRGSGAKSVTVDLTGANKMLLVATDGGRWPYNNPLDLGDATITMKSGKPEAVALPVDPAPRIAPASAYATKTAIHGPRIYGASTGCPLLYSVSATGEGALTYAARNLPAGQSHQREGHGATRGDLQLR